jgi:multimeric flavodoxin WrbA
MAGVQPAHRKMLGIIGSARRGGNTEVLVDEILAGAAEAGAQTEKVVLSTLDIGPCRGCDACAKAGKCIQGDDMHALLEQMAQSDVWVFGTPVYYWGPTAQFKAFVDRWYSTEHQVTPTTVEFKDKHVILAIPLGGAAHDARHTVGMIKDALAYKRTELFATIVASGAEERGAVRDHADVLAQARRAGRAAIEK